MTIENLERVEFTTGNGVTTVFPFDFRVIVESSLHVETYQISTGIRTTINPSEYTVSLGSDAGGSITYNPSGVPLSSDYRLVVYTITPQTQETTISNQQAYNAEVVSEVWDKLTALIQENGREVNRALKLSLYDASQLSEPFTTVLPRPGYSLIGSPAGTGLVEGPTGPAIESAQFYGELAETSAASAVAAAIEASLIANSAATLLRNPTLTANGTDTYALSHDLPVGLVFIDGVQQNFTAFTHDQAGLEITFAENVPTGAEIEVLYSAGTAAYSLLTFETVSSFFANTTVAYSNTAVGSTVISRADQLSWEVAPIGFATTITVNGVQYKVPENQETQLGHFGWTGSGGAADMTALTNCLDYLDGKQLNLKGKTLTFDTAFTYSGAVDLYNGTMDFSGGGSFTADSGLTQIANLSGDISRGQSRITFASAHGLVEGDVFCVWDTRDFSWSHHRPAYHDGDWMRVARVLSSTQVKIYGQAPDDYAAVNMECYKIGGASVTLEKLGVIPKASGEMISIVHAQGVRVRDLFCPAGNSNRNVLIYKSYGIDVSSLRSTVLEGNGYTFTVANCKKANLSGSEMYSDRHGVSFGGGSGPGTVPTREFVVGNMALTNVDEGLGVLEAHGNCDGGVFVGCIADSGFNMGGRDMSMIGGSVKGRIEDAAGSTTNAGNCVRSAEIVGGLYQFNGVHFISDGANASFGVLDFVPYGYNTAYNDPPRYVGIREPWTLRLDGCTITQRDEADGSIMRVVKLDVGSSVVEGRSPPDEYHPIRVELRGLTVDSKYMFALFGMNGQDDMRPYVSLLVDDSLVAPTDINSGGGTPLLMAASGGGGLVNYEIPVRLPKQVVKTDFAIRAADGTSGYSALPSDYKWAFPSGRTPMCTYGITTQSGALAIFPVGEGPIVYNVDGEEGTFRTRIQVSETGATFSLDTDVTVTTMATLADF